ncbi:hypothetical protein ACIOUE_34370 [Streptomyces xanthochromogenes]|uniref:hypothetical protein n=1 Tax=Streptomyces xanthochromogenes TaxID=67384 RepID=UPI00343D3A7F
MDAGYRRLRTGPVGRGGEAPPGGIRGREPVSVGSSWKRTLTVFSRVEPAGAAAASTELLCRSAPYGRGGISPVRPNADRDGPAEVVR